MDKQTILDYLTATYRVAVVEDSGNAFIFYDPGNQLPTDRQFPFLTLVTNDLYDEVSDLSRPYVYRLNISIGKRTFQSLFPDYVRSKERITGSYDYTMPDRLLPHPVYGSMYWCCILNPATSTFEQSVKPLLEEAYQQAARLYTKRNN